MKAPFAAVLVSCAVVLAGCARRPAEPAAKPPPPPLTEWPQGHAAALKVTDSLILEIPLQYERAAIESDHEPARALISAQSDRREAQFDFFLPDFSGYTPANYQNEFDENKVEVVYLHAGDPHEAEPGAPGEYPPNMLKRALGESLNAGDHQDMFGLRCYQGRVRNNRLTCYGRRDLQRGEDIMLSASVPPFAAADTFPQLQARYFSKRYDGVRIAWRTNAKNLARWHDIDAQIWTFIEAWNVAPAADYPGAKSAARPAGERR